MSGNAQEKNTTSLKHRYMMVAITTTPFGLIGQDAMNTANKFI